MKQSGFNPNARWDRNIPETGQNNKSTGNEIDEIIEVLVLFKNSQIFPKQFLWKNKAYQITNINYHWQERTGKEVINYFSVQSGQDSYQISFNNSSYGWRLDKIL